MKIHQSLLILLFLAAFISCEKEDPCNGNEPFVEPAWVFDSLQGVWVLTSTYNPKIGMIENDFESTVHFLSMNSDSTINYETYKNDTLKKSGKLTIYKTAWGRKIEPDILLHNYNMTNENYFEFISEDTLKLFELFEDRYEHFYKKINQAAFNEATEMEMEVYSETQLLKEKRTKLKGKNTTIQTAGPCQALHLCFMDSHALIEYAHMLRTSK